MRSVLIAISTVLVLTSPIIYIHSIVRGETRPHRTTRFVLLVICFLSTAALLDENHSSAFWLSAASTVQATATFALSIKWGYGGWAKLDIACLVIAIIGLIFWQISGNALVGLYAAITADIVGIVPTFVKTYKLPRTENWQFFAIDTVAGLLSLMAIAGLTLYTASYPIYIVLVNGALAALIIVRQRAVSPVQTHHEHRKTT